ncbi:MAG TPA: hypothetical protein VI456_01790 [Polyangia bacterium]
MTEQATFDPNRQLCPDGSCVGVLGADGLCNVCARPEGASAEAEAEVPGDVGAEDGDGFDSTRRLCDDGSCVGVIGADGACGTCGRKAS